MKVDLLVIGAGQAGTLPPSGERNSGSRSHALKGGEVGWHVSRTVASRQALLESSEKFPLRRGLRSHGILAKTLKVDVPAMLSRKDGLTN